MNKKNETIDKKIHDTYYSPKNKEILPVVIFFSLVFLIFKPVIVFEIVLWCWYFYYCEKNNEELRNNEYIIKRRKILLESKKISEKGDI